MRLLVVRHAIAEDSEAFAVTGRDDALRPLTEDGIRKMRRAVRGLRQLVPSIDLLAASPLTRAAQTAEIVRAEYDMPGIQTTSSLEPDATVEEVVEWLGTLDAGTVAVVGHEPQLGRLVTFLIGGGDRTGVELKKGAAALLDSDGHPAPGDARLVWSIPPTVLRDLAG